MSANQTHTAESCAYVVGDDGLSRWSDVHADAWIGLLETHKRLRPRARLGARGASTA